MLLPIHRWLPYNHELAAPVQGLLERTKTQLFSIAPLGLYPRISNKRRICDIT